MTTACLSLAENLHSEKSLELLEVDPFFRRFSGLSDVQL